MGGLRSRVFRVACVVTAGALWGRAAVAQEILTAPVGEDEPYVLDTGVHDNVTATAVVVFDGTISMPGRAWIRVYFADVRLADGSYVRMTSAFDGASQELDAVRAAEWSNTSAYFNGDAVVLELVAGPNTTGNRIVVDHVSVSADRSFPAGTFCGECGLAGREPSDEAFTGRLMPVGCTASLYNANSCFVSAGHCIIPQLVMEFNVPPSLPGGGLQHPGPEDQYAVDGASIEFVNGGVGNDWSKFACFSNPVTGLTAYGAQGDFRPIARNLPAMFPEDIDIFGYGVDMIDVLSQTQQHSPGPLTGTSGPSAWTHLADTTGGNSGSAILHDGEIIGIVTHCTFGCPNFGTKVDLDTFVDAWSACGAFDFDADDDVDAADFQAFQVCFSVMPMPPGCEVFDADHSGRVAPLDWPPFLDAMTGPLP